MPSASHITDGGALLNSTHVGHVDPPRSPVAALDALARVLQRSTGGAPRANALEDATTLGGVGGTGLAMPTRGVPGGFEVEPRGQHVASGGPLDTPVGHAEGVAQGGTTQGRHLLPSGGDTEAGSRAPMVGAMSLFQGTSPYAPTSTCDCKPPALGATPAAQVPRGDGEE